MIFRIFSGESSLVRGRVHSHISCQTYNLINNRGFIKFPKIFQRRNPELLSKIKVNLHDHNTGFINFINSLNSLISRDDVTTEAFIELFEQFESSLSDDNEHIVNTLDSFDTLGLLSLLDSLTIYTQTRTSRNIINFLNNLCTVLSNRDLLKTPNGELDISYNMALMDVLNRINYESKQVKSLISSVNRQARHNLDQLIQNGIFTQLMNLYSYTFDPNSVYTIVYCCMFKLDEFKCKDYSNLPEFLFKFKIFDEDILSKVVSHASSSVCSTFESNSESLSKFVKGLLLFEPIYENRNISFSPSVVFLTKLKSNITNYNDEELLFLLSSLPSEKHFVGSTKDEVKDFTGSILLKMGILSESMEFMSLSHLSNDKLMNFIKYVNKTHLPTSGLEWNNLKSLLLKGKSENNAQELSFQLGETSFLNDFAKELSNRFLKEVFQNCKLVDVDDVFKHPAMLSRLMALLNKFYLHSVDGIYLDSFSLSLKRLLSLLGESDFPENELVKFIDEVSKLNIKLFTDFSSQIFRLAARNNLELMEKALRLKLLCLKKNNSPSETSEMIEYFNSFEPLVVKPDYKSFLTLVNLLDVFNKAKQLSDGAHSEEFNKCFEKFSGMALDCMKEKFGLFTFKSMLLLLNLPLDCRLLSELDNLTDLQVESAKVPQLVTIFVYKIKRARSDTQGLESVKKVYEVLMCKLEELINLLDNTFGQRIWLPEPTNDNNIKKINPWLNEHGMRALLKKPREHLDMFLYEKCPKLDGFFPLNRFSHYDLDNYGDKMTINSLNDLKMELIDLSRKIGSQELEFSSKGEKKGEYNRRELISKIASELRRATLAVEMCRPISRDYHLPRKHTEQLIKLSHKKFSNLKRETCSGV